MNFQTRAILGLITLYLTVFLISGCGVKAENETPVPMQQSASPTDDRIPDSDASKPVSSSETPFISTPSSAAHIEKQTNSPTLEGSDYSKEDPFVQKAIRDLQNRLNVTADLVIIASVEPVEWNDASLGCAQPGSMSAQVITPGYLVTLQVGDEQYLYHTDVDTRVILCGDDGLPVPTDFSLPEDPNINDGQPWMPAD